MDTAYLYVNNQEYEMYRVANNTLFDYYEASVEVAGESFITILKSCPAKMSVFIIRLARQKN